MVNNVTEITKDALLSSAAGMLQQGYRFVTITVIDLGETFDILYHFDKDYQLVNYRLKLPKGEDLPSICGTYLAAVVVENEMKDLFGINLTGLALDFQGRFLLAEECPKAPLLKQSRGTGILPVSPTAVPAVETPANEASMGHGPMGLTAETAVPRDTVTPEGSETK